LQHEITAEHGRKAQPDPYIKYTELYGALTNFDKIYKLCMYLIGWKTW